jgi:protein-disulfide isomerase
MENRMINRRQMTAGLTSSLAAMLTGCGGGGVTSTSNGGANWQSSFDLQPEQVGSAKFKRRTEPATVAELMQPGPLKEMSLGPATAKVTVIEYFSLTCPVCHAFHKNTWPIFKRTYIDTGKIRYIAREFPIGRASGNATIALRCQENRYFDLLNRFLAEQKRWVSQEVRLGAIHSVAAPLGLTRAKFDSCLANQAMIDGINAVKQRGRELGVIGTPTFFINGKQLRGVVTMEQMRAEIDPLLG